jgi:predicted transcriptional regulator
MKVLLSVKPEFANKIFSGVKKYEYRRAIFKNNVNRVIVYASSPVQKLIGEFEIESII